MLKSRQISDSKTLSLKKSILDQPVFDQIYFNLFLFHFKLSENGLNNVQQKSLISTKPSPSKL